MSRLAGSGREAIHKSSSFKPPATILLATSFLRRGSPSSRPTSLSFMKKPLFLQAQMLAVALLLGPAAYALNLNEQAAIGLSRTYGFVYGQRTGLERIEQQFPDLRSQVEFARIQFTAKFPRLEERLEKTLTAALP